VLLNLLVNVWAQAVKTEVPAALPSGYADDTGATSPEPGPIQSVLDVTGQFAKVTGQVLNASKSHCWGTCISQRHELANLTLMEQPVPLTTGGRLLGAHVAYQRGVKNALGDKRVKQGVIVCERIRWAPLPMHVRAKLLASLVIPSALYGVSVGGLTLGLLNSLTSAVMRAVWGTKRKLRSKEIVLSLFVPGHLVDPTQSMVYQCLCTLRKFACKRPDLIHVLRNCWQACVVEGDSAPGPVGLIHRAVLSIGWSWDCFDSFERPGRSPLPLCEGPDTWWLHELRDGLRLSKWAIAASKRDDMQGLQAVQGVDRQATLALLNSRKTPAETSGILRGIVSGSVRLQKRLYQAGIVESPLCPFCNMCEETCFHCYWECPKWDALRLEFHLPCRRVRADWPACTSNCSIFLEDPNVTALVMDLEREQPILADLEGHFHCNECRARIASDVGSSEPQVVWTDGASSKNQDYRFRRAGSGIFYGPGHDLNFSCFLPGLLQTNQRAELFAVLLACLRDPRALDIRSDSDYVCKGVSTWRTWCDGGWHGESADLWNMLASELCARETNVSVSWVKGHAKQIDIDRGRTTREDKAGNDGADELAVAGAKAHEVCPEVVRSAKSRQFFAKQVQGMMVRVLKARMLEEQRLSGVQVGHDDSDDRGSDAGSCMCMEFVADDVDAANEESDIEGEGVSFLYLDDDLETGSSILSDVC
jgi:ribonuclease HI